MNLADQLAELSLAHTTCPIHLALFTSCVLILFISLLFTAFSTDAKPYRKIIVSCLEIARANSIQLRRTYAKEVKRQKLECRFSGPPKNLVKARKAGKRLKTITSSLVREIERKSPAKVLTSIRERFAQSHRALQKKRG